MKKIFLVIVVIGLTVSAMSQITIQSEKQIKELDKEIRSLKSDISKLERKLPDIYYPKQIEFLEEDIKQLQNTIEDDSTLSEHDRVSLGYVVRSKQRLLKKYIRKNGKVDIDLIKQQIEKKKTRMAFLSDKQDSIFDVRATQPGYEELTILETNRKNRALYVKRNQLALDKLASSPVIANPINGYKGVILNLSRASRCNFVIQDANYDFEPESFFLEPGSKEECYLIPGDYICSVYIMGSLVGEHRFNVSSQLKKVLGERVHWGVWREGN